MKILKGIISFLFDPFRFFCVNTQSKSVSQICRPLFYYLLSLVVACLIIYFFYHIRVA